MKLLFTIILTGVILAPTAAPAQVPGEMLFKQGCDAFDLVDDLGSFITLLGQEGRWLMRNLGDGTEVVYAFETIDLVPPILDDPFEFAGTTLVAWQIEGTGIRGTNRSSFSGTIEPNFDFVVFFEGETIRGNRYSSGGISGTASGSFIGEWGYDEVRMVLCKAGLGGN